MAMKTAENKELITQSFSFLGYYINIDLTFPCRSTVANAAASIFFRTSVLLSPSPVDTKNEASSVTRGGDSKGAN